MNNEPPVHIVIGNFSDLKHKINNKWPNDSLATLCSSLSYHPPMQEMNAL